MIKNNSLILRKLLLSTVILGLGGYLSACTGQASQQTLSAAAHADAKATLTQEQLRSVESFENAAGGSHGKSLVDVANYQKRLENNPVFKNRFLGVPTFQNPSDAWVMMEVIYDVKPDLIVEAGTLYGGSANLWAIILEQVNPGGKVITIDIKDQRPNLAKNLPIAKERVQFLLGSSTDEDIVAEVHRQAEGKRVLVLLDSLHSKEHVAAELQAYSSLVGVDSYIIVQDTASGPAPAIDEFIEENSEFVVDLQRERYSDSVTKGGYLKRAKE